MAATDKNMNFDVNLLPTTNGDHNLGSSDKRWNLYINQIDGIKTTDINPISSRIYSNYTVSANDEANGVIYFGTVTLNNTSNYYAPWYVHYTLEVTTSENQTQGQYDVWFGCCGSEVRYKIFNHFYSGSYYPIYHHRFLYPKSGYSAQGAHLGVRVQSARNPTTLARTYTIKILETYGCTIAFKDSLTKYSTLANNTYFYNGEYTGTSVGLQETGDSDTWASLVRTTYIRNTIGAVGIMRYGLFMEDSDGNLQGLSYGNPGVSDGTTSSTIHTINTTTKFRVGKVFYRQRSDDLAANNSTDTNNSWKMWLYDLVDLRYTFNAGTNLTPRGSFYLMGTLDSNGYFSLSGVGYSQTMSDTTKAYIYIGQVYNDVNGYRCSLELDNPCYWYKNGAWRKYISTFGTALSVDAGGTGAITAANARTNLGAAASDHTHSNITNAGAITSTEAIANGDKITIINASDNSKLIGSTITFDGSTATKALTQKGTWETFNNYSHPTTDGNKHVPANGTTNNGKYLQATGTAGTYQWANLPTASTTVAGITTVGASGGAAAYSHGNHVPATETANNAKFLRNDNTWQTVTPANIGAATSDHTHNYAGSSSAGGTANDANELKGKSETSGAITTAANTGCIRYSYNVNNGTTGLFDAVSNANGILNINKHSGNYNSQLGFSSNGKIYYRNFNNVALNTTTTWEQIAFISDINTSDTKNTAGTTNSTSKLYLAGATSQAANPQTYSYVYTYVNNGLLSSTKLGLNASGTEKAHLEWNATDLSIDFVFN